MTTKNYIPLPKIARVQLAKLISNSSDDVNEITYSHSHVVVKLCCKIGARYGRYYFACEEDQEVDLELEHEHDKYLIKKAREIKRSFRKAFNHVRNHYHCREDIRNQLSGSEFVSYRDVHGWYNVWDVGPYGIYIRYNFAPDGTKHNPRPDEPWRIDGSPARGIED